MARTVADQLIAQLIEAGVSRIYGVVGDSLNPVVDAVRRTGGSRKGGIDWIPERHEEAGAFAASAEAQLTGKLAVCAGSCGPGHLHLINGLYDAHRSGAPVLAIASHITTNQIGSGYFQETHPDRLFVECSHYTEMISTAVQAPRVVDQAMRHSLALGGVSVITLPGDVAEFPAEGEAPAFSLPRRPAIVPAEEDVRALAAAIDEAGSVAIFAGRGAGTAHAELMELADKIAAPVGHSLRGKDVIQQDNPFDVGMTGLIGYGAAAAGISGADLLILIGTDFPYDQFLPGKEVRTAQIDIAPERLGRRTDVDIAIHGDALSTIRAVLPLVQRKTNRRFLEKLLKEQDRKVEQVVGAYTTKAEKLRPIHPEYAASILDEVAADDAVFLKRHGHVQRMDRAVHHPERTAADARVARARVHGQRAADGDRRAGRAPGAAGRVGLGRRRPVHAHGRARDRGRLRLAREGRRVQQLDARAREGRDARRRDPRLRRRRAHGRLRGGGGRARDPLPARRGPRRHPRRARGRVRARRARARRTS